MQHDRHETSSTVSHQVGTAVQARRSTTPPPQRRMSDAADARPSPNTSASRPKTMYAVASQITDIKAVAKGGKKRPAPPPPQQKLTPVSPQSSSQLPSVREDAVIEAVKAPVAATGPPVVATSLNGGGPQGLSRLHSRNSSDSSGYHEAEMTLSGAESPEAAPKTASASFKTSIDTTSIDSGEHHPNGDSGIMESPRVESIGPQKVEKVEQPRLPPSTKKKKAPPPPPKGNITVLNFISLKTFD